MSLPRPPPPFSISPEVFDIDAEVSSISNKTKCKSSFRLPLSLAKRFPNPLLYTIEILQLSLGGCRREVGPQEPVPGSHFPAHWFCDPEDLSGLLLPDTK